MDLQFILHFAILQLECKYRQHVTCYHKSENDIENCTISLTSRHNPVYYYGPQTEQNRMGRGGIVVSSLDQPYPPYTGIASAFQFIFYTLSILHSQFTPVPHKE